MTNFTEADFNKFSEKERMNRTLEGIAYWAFVQKPKHSDKYSTDTFTITLALDTPEALKKAESWGMTIKPADKYVPLPYVEISRKVRPGKTIEECKPEVVDSVQSPVTDLIGNGSRVMVKFGTYFFNGTRTSLFKVKINDLVPYVSKGSAIDRVDEGGYQATGSTSEKFDA
jgi:hypothetical protein